MSILKFFLGLILLAGLLAGTVALVHFMPLVEQLEQSFTAVTPWLPVWLTFEQTLLILIVAALAVAVLALVVAVVFAGLAVAARVREHAHKLTVDQTLQQSRLELKEEYERLLKLTNGLTQRLGKSALLNNVLVAAKQVTSLPRVESIVGLWVINFENDRLEFARGIRCDETVFTKREFELEEAPFKALALSHAVVKGDKWSEVFSFAQAEKLPLLHEASAAMLVPLVIERTVLGVLVIFCAPEIVKGYDAQQAFYQAAWGQLALALGIAVQEELAILDRLTGVVNHAYFVKRLSQEIERSNRYHMPLSILMIDVDNFKAVNDQLGHPQGDATLRIVARLVKREVRGTDLVGRYGGEEFIALLPETGFVDGVNGVSGPQLAAERIRKAVEMEFKHLPKPLSITVSIGIAVRRFPQERQQDAREVIRIADEQLYKAKATGKNKWSVAIPADLQAPAAGSPAPAAGQAPPAPAAGQAPQASPGPGAGH